jgi:hypothetical protein
MSATATNLPPIVITGNSPLVPDWAKEAVRRLNLLTGAQINSNGNPLGGYGAGAWAFGDQNAELLIPSGFSGQVVLAKLTVSGSNGSLTMSNGRVISVNQPS